MRGQKGQHNEVAERIHTLQSFLQELHGWYVQVKALPPSTLRNLIGIGAGITRWLPTGKHRKGGK